MATRARVRPKAEVSGADLGLIRRCLAGDPQAWADLYLRYRTPLYALCLSWTHDHAFAEDVVHDAFVRAYEQMKTFDQTRRFFPWLAAIAKNCLRDIHRRQRRKLQVEMPDDAANRTAIDSTIEAVIDLEERARVHEALASLPTSQRTALLLAELEGLSYAQVAQSVGATESAVKSLIFRARAMLRRSLQPLPVILGLRALRQRISNGMRRASTVAARFQLEATVIDSLGLSVALAALAVLPLPALGDIQSKHPLAVAAIGDPIDRHASQPVSIAAISLDPSPGTNLHPRKSAAAVKPTIKVWGTSPDNVAPSEGDISLEIVGPDGTVLYRNSTDFRCDGQGADLLPQSGPVRAVC